MSTSNFVYTPWFRSPFTDMTGCMVSHQWEGRCQEMELKFVECLEAYGLERGMSKCEVLFRDFKECSTREKHYRRQIAMRMERERQYSAGERSKENHYAPAPRIDSY